MRYYTGFRTTSTNEGVIAFTLTSTEEEKKRMVSVCYTDVLTNALTAEMMLEREYIMQNIHLEVIADATPVREFELNLEIPVGETVKFQIRPLVAGSQGTLVGYYIYELVV